MIRRIPYPLPQKRQKVRSEIARAPQRVWLRHRKFVRSHHCCVPGCEAYDVQFAHIRTAANAGTGLKPHDRYGVPLCFNHHREQHDCGQGTFEDRHGIDLDALAAELVRRSPDVRMRLALMEEDQAGPLMAKPDRVAGDARQKPGRPSCNPRSRVAATHSHQGAAGEAQSADDPAAAEAAPYRLAGHLSRISRLIPYEGFVS